MDGRKHGRSSGEGENALNFNKYEIKGNNKLLVFEFADEDKALASKN